MRRCGRFATIVGLAASALALPGPAADAVLPGPGVPAVPGHSDAAWGDGGVAHLDLGDARHADAVHVAVAAGGARLVATSVVDIAVERLGPDGTPDADWGDGGMVRLPPLASWDQGQRPHVVALPDGSAVVLSNAPHSELPAARARHLDPDGALDPEYGTDGVPPVLPGVVADAEPTADGGLVVLMGQGLVGRLGPDGARDLDFGTNGEALPAGVTSPVLAHDLAVDADGSIVVTGTATGDATLLAWRFDAAGDPDPTFGNGGVARLLPGEVSGGGGLVPDGDGWLAGATLGAPGRSVVLRLDHDGALDDGWDVDVTVAGDSAVVDLARVGTDVHVALAVGEETPGTHAAVAVVGADGTVLEPGAVLDDLGGAVHVAGLAGADLVVATNHGEASARAYLLRGGQAVELGARTDRLEEPAGVLVRADGGVVVLGSVDDDALVLRLRPDGSLDPAFADDGMATWREGIADRITLTDGVLLADGRLVVVGRQDGEAGVHVARLLADGRFDPTFGQDGRTGIAARGPDPRVAVDALGRVLVTTDAGVHRLLADGAPDPGFGSAGSAALPGLDAVVTDVAVRPGGAVLAGSTGDGLARRAVALGLGPAGAPDPAFAGGAVLTLPVPAGPATGTAATAVRVRPDGRVVVTATGNDTFLVRLGTDGALDPTFGLAGVATRTSPGPARSAPAAGSIVTSRPHFGGVLVERFAADGSFDDRYSTYAAPGSAQDEPGLWDAVGDDGAGRAALARMDFDADFRTRLSVTRYLGGELAPKPTVDVGDTVAVEGTGPGAGTGGRLRFPVTLSAPSLVPVTATYRPTTGGTVDPTDLAASDNVRTVTIPPGATRGEIVYELAADGEDEPAELLVVGAIGFEYGVAGDTRATGTVIDDDGWGAMTPPAPPGVAVSAGAGHVTATWSAPPPGHAATRLYSVVVVQDGVITGWRFFPEDARAGSVAGLRNGRPADVYVAAWTGAGFGALAGPYRVQPAAGGRAITPAAAPHGWSAWDHDGFVRVLLGPPPADGGSTIIAHAVVVVDAGGQVVGWRNVGPDVRSVAFPDLPGDGHEVLVAAVTDQGFGAFARQAATTSSGGDVPAQQSAWVVATPGARAVTALWGPAPEQGRPVLGYVVRFVQGSSVVWQNVGPDRRTTGATGLQPGVPVEVTVFPYDAGGFGDYPATPQRATPTA